MDEAILNEGEPRLGMFMRRAVAYLVDTAILCAVFLLMRLLLDDVLEPLYINILLNVITLLYFSIMESSSRQATIGKGLLGLIVTDRDGNALSFGRALLRNFARYINFFLFGLGYLTLFFTKRRQCLHDLIGRTCVVMEGEAGEEDDIFQM